ncbi:putative transmembrane protein [Toxoplasma gondii FOU]|uniref:Putative transmembrane protein n=2 Tax=Toxoplasma gondii TaxID=5811 RepID=A0A086LIG9_TOXGO|nr:putative transmembrane protein [Toxoplasma gondii FOU]PUA86715.1 putative transmembrane protein [Toxoplasma gondii TgCATBr9]
MMVSRTPGSEQEPSSRGVFRSTGLGTQSLLTRIGFHIFLALLLAFLSFVFTPGPLALARPAEFTRKIPQREGATFDVASLSYRVRQSRPTSFFEETINTSSSAEEHAPPTATHVDGVHSGPQRRRAGSEASLLLLGRSESESVSTRGDPKRVLDQDVGNQRRKTLTHLIRNRFTSPNKEGLTLHGARELTAETSRPSGKSSRDGSNHEAHEQVYQLSAVGGGAHLKPQRAYGFYEAEHRTSLKNATRRFVPAEQPVEVAADESNLSNQAESNKDFFSALAASAKMHAPFVSEFLAPWTRLVVGTCLSTTSFICCVLLVVYLYFAVRILALCRALRLQSVLNSRGDAASFFGRGRSDRTYALAKHQTWFSGEGGFDTEWILGGWPGTALTALSGFGEPWEHVLSKAAAARMERLKLQAAERPSLDWVSCSATKAQAMRDCKPSTEADEVDLSEWDRSRLFEGPIGVHFSLSPYGSNSCCQTVFGSRHLQTIRTSPGVLDPFETWGPYPGEHASVDTADTQEEPAFQLAATYMQNRTFVWWASYFVATCAFIILFLLMALEADQLLLSRAFLALGGRPLQLSSFWQLLAALHWVSALCLLRGILSDYSHATNGAFHGRQKFFLSVILSVLSFIFLFVIFDRESSYPAQCLGQHHSLPPMAATAGPNSPKELPPSPKRIAGPYGSRREEEINADVFHKDATALSAFAFIIPESATVLDPYTYGRATQRPSNTAAVAGSGWSPECAAIARVSAYRLGLSVACFLFLRLFCLFVVLSLATSEDAFQQKRDSQATVSFSWLVAGVSFALVDLFPFPLLSTGPLAHWFPVRGVDILLCSQCLCHLFFFKHVQRELYYATHSSIKVAIRKMQETFCLKSFD